MVGHDASDGKMPTNLQNFVQYVVYLFSDELITDHVNIIEDHRTISEFLHGDGVAHKAFVDHDTLGFDIIEALVVGQGAEEVYGIMLVLLLILLEILARIGRLAAAAWPRNV